MGEGLVILAILESIDKAAALPRQAAVTVAKDAIQRLLSTLDSLKRWSDAFYIRFGRAPLFGTLLIEGSEGEWTKLWVPKHYRCKRSDILLGFSGHLLGDRRATYPHIPRSWFRSQVAGSTHQRTEPAPRNEAAVDQDLPEYQVPDAGGYEVVRAIIYLAAVASSLDVFLAGGECTRNLLGPGLSSLTPLPTDIASSMG